jgi:hypothetical protein
MARGDAGQWQQRAREWQEQAARWRAKCQAAEAMAAAAMGRAGPVPEPPPEFVLAYESPQPRRFQRVVLPGGIRTVINAEARRRSGRTAAQVWGDLIQRLAA